MRFSVNGYDLLKHSNCDRLIQPEEQKQFQKALILITAFYLPRVKKPPAGGWKMEREDGTGALFAWFATTW